MFWAAVLLIGRAWAGPLDYPKGRFEAQVREVSRAGGHVEYEVRFPSPLKSGHKANDTVWGRLSVPTGDPGKRYPCILILPVMAAPNLWIEERFFKRFRKDGFAVLLLEMPYQFRRRPHPSVPTGHVFLARTAGRLAFNFRQSVLDARRGLEFLSRHPSVDPKRIGLFGISLGAIVGSAAYSVDPTPKHAVFLLAGAHFPSLVMASSETGPYLRKAQIPLADLIKAWKGIDPVEYREKNRGKRVLLLNVTSDRSIPRPNALKLKEAFPDSRQVWLPFGHYTAMLHLIWVPRYISKDFLSNL